MSEQRENLEAIKLNLTQNRDLIVPVFGFMFWQLSEAEKSLSAEDFAKEGMNLTLDHSDDEVIATFMADYIKLWLSANDFNAASRFIANCLAMSADELLQTRQVYLDQIKNS